MSAPSRPRRGPGRKRSETSRLAVLYATRALVDELGYERLTIGGIAARAGVGKDTIYRWWPSKGLIVADAILDLEPANDDPDAPRAAFFTEPPPDTGNLAADMQEWVRQLARDYVEGPGAARVRAVTAAATEDPATAARLVERFTQPKQAAVVARLEAAAHNGEVRLDADLAAVADSIMATLFYWAISRRCAAVRSPVHRQVADARRDVRVSLLWSSHHAVG